MTDSMQTLSAQVADRIISDFDTLLQEIISRRFGVEVTPSNAHEFVGRGACAVFPDKTEVWSWDGVPFLKTWPGTSAIVDGHISFKQNYQEL